MSFMYDSRLPLWDRTDSGQSSLARVQGRRRGEGSAEQGKVVSATSRFPRCSSSSPSSEVASEA